MPDSPRKIFVLTGKRGGFGAMKPMLRADPALGCCSRVIEVGIWIGVANV